MCVRCAYLCVLQIGLIPHVAFLFILFLTAYRGWGIVLTTGFLAAASVAAVTRCPPHIGGPQCFTTVSHAAVKRLLVGLSLFVEGEPLGQGSP